MFRTFHISSRMTFLVAFMFLFVVAVGGGFTYFMNLVQQNSLATTQTTMTQGYERTLRYNVQSIVSLLKREMQKAQATGNDPQAVMRDIVASAKYGENGYFFVFDLTGVIQAHGARPDFIGTNRLDHKDVKGHYNVREALQKAREGGGFVTYWFTKPGHKEPSPKMVYAQLIPDTTLVVESGLYIDDIQQERDRVAQILTDITHSALTTIGLLFGGVLLFLVLPLSIGIVRSITGPLRSATAMAQDIAGGNLDVAADEAGRDEVTRLEQALNLMIRTLKENMREIEAKSADARRQTEVAREAAAAAEKARGKAERAKSEGMSQAASRLEDVVVNLAAAAEQISGRSEEIRRGTDVQTERIASTATAMEEMNATVLEIARNSNEAAGIGTEAMDKAREGAQTVRLSVEAMQVTSRQAQELQRNMDQLGQQADAIGQVMNVISDIADQTNLLALNAAIEAARAGDAGRGFAVVADEVRKLAEKTMGATKEVGASIQAIQTVARDNITSMQKAVTDLGKAVDLADASGKVLTEIVGRVETSADQIQGIATAAEQQSATSEEINASVDEINRITRETAQGVEQTAAAIRGLAEQTTRLRSLVDELKQG